MQPLMLHSLVDIPVEIDATNGEVITVRPSSRFSYPIILTNVGNRSLEWSELHPLNLSYRWLSEDGEVLEQDGRRTSLLVNRLTPGKRHELKVLGHTPDDAGLYQLQVSLVLEGVHWACDVSPTGWSTVALQLSPAPAWPEALGGSVGGRALRGAMVASELDRLLNRHPFTVKRAPSDVDYSEQQSLPESSLDLNGREQRAWLRRLGDWLRRVLGVSGLQHQIEEVLTLAGRQERLVRELESQILLLREDLGFETDLPGRDSLEFKKDMAEARKKLKASQLLRQAPSSHSAPGTFRSSKSGRKARAVVNND